MRRHGWQRPLHPLQMVGMAVYIFLVVAFYCFLGLFLGNRVAEITVTTIFSFAALSVMFLFIRCTAIDPSDKTHTKKKSRRSKSKFLVNVSYGFILSQIVRRFFRRLESKILRAFIRRKYFDSWQSKGQMEPLLPFPLVMNDDAIAPDPREDDISFCLLCDFEVKKHSKHCRTCNRCVEGFDHHCRWLNNCVGKKNYTTFILLMLFLLFMLTIEGGTAIAIFVRCFADKQGVEHELEKKLYVEFPRGVLAVISVLLVLITAYSLAALGQLFFFHVVLIRKMNCVGSGRSAAKAASLVSSKIVRSTVTKTPRRKLLEPDLDVDILGFYQDSELRRGHSRILSRFGAKGSQLVFRATNKTKTGMRTYDYILAMREENQSMELESFEDSDFSSDESIDSVSPEKPTFVSRFICRESRINQNTPKLSIRIDGEPEPPSLTKNQAFRASIDPWKLITMSRDKALLAAEKARERLKKQEPAVGRDSLKPLPLETKSGPLLNTERNVADVGSGLTPLISMGRVPGSPGRFSSPRRRFSNSPNMLSSSAATPKQKYRSNFDLKLTEVSRELETYISRQVLCSLLKKDGSETSPR